MEKFFRRYLVYMSIASPLALMGVVGVVMVTGAVGNASALIGLVGGVALLIVSAILAARQAG